MSDRRTRRASFRAGLGVRAAVRLVAAVAVLVALPPRASAQVSAQDKAVADALFKDGVRLLRAGKFADACPKLAESERIDPAVGTALYLGDCYERIGKVASAQAMFQEGYDFARRLGDARAAIAKDHHDQLKPSTLTVVLAPDARADGLDIRRDDIGLSPAELGLPLPADGGRHLIVATAPGKKSFETTISVPLKEGAVSVTIPKLADDERPSADSTVAIAPVPAEPRSNGRRVVGLAVGGAGVAVLAFGAISGLVALLDWDASNSAENGCDSGSTRCLTQHGVDLRSSAGAWATVSTGGFIAGGVLAVAGAVLFLTAPKTSHAERAWTVAPTFFASGAGLAAAGRF